MTSRIALSGLVVAMLLSGASAAQQPASKDNVPMRDGVQARSPSASALQQYAGCIAKYRTRLAARLALSMPTTAEEKRFAKQIFRDGYCIHSGGLMLQPHLIRGALAEALLEHRDFGPSPFAADETFESFSAKAKAADANGLSSEDEIVLTDRWIAYCTVGKAEPAVRELSKAVAGSPEERARVQALVPDIRGCLPDGRRLTVTAGSLRFLLAEALFMRQSGRGR